MCSSTAQYHTMVTINTERFAPPPVFQAPLCSTFQLCFLCCHALHPHISSRPQRRPVFDAFDLDVGRPAHPRLPPFHLLLFVLCCRAPQSLCTPSVMTPPYVMIFNLSLHDGMYPPRLFRLFTSHSPLTSTSSAKRSPMAPPKLCIHSSSARQAPDVPSLLNLPLLLFSAFHPPLSKRFFFFFSTCCVCFSFCVERWCMGLVLLDDETAVFFKLHRLHEWSRPIPFRYW